jgi:hypothetical protein
MSASRKLQIVKPLIIKKTLAFKTVVDKNLQN